MSVRWGYLSADGSTIIAIAHSDGAKPPDSVPIPQDAEVGWTLNGNGTATQTAFPSLKSYFFSRLINAQTVLQAGDTVANTTTQTAFASTVVIPANTLASPMIADVRASFVFSTTGTPNLNLRLKFDAGIVLATGNIALPNNSSGLLARLDASILVYANGNVDVEGGFTFSSGATGATPVLIAGTPQTPNFGADHTLSVTAQWGTANASNTIQMRQFAAFRQG